MYCGKQVIKSFSLGLRFFSAATI